MPYYKIYIHLIWATKNRHPFLKEDIRKEIFRHILDKAKEYGIYIDCIGGVENHIHILIHMRTDQSVSNITHLIKGESSRWINKNKLTRGRFRWQEEYMAYSVSPSAKNKIQRYIARQEEHHKKNPSS